MPTTAETSQVKRLISDLLFADGEEEKSNKRHRSVRFDDNVEVLLSADKNSGDESLSNQEEDEEGEEVDFVLSIGEDGEWDYTITTTTTTMEKDDVPPTDENKVDLPSPFKKSRPASPFAGCDRRLCAELYMSSSPMNESREEEEAGELFRVNSNSSLGNNLKISITACNGHLLLDSTATATDAVMPTPLITPPSSPRRVQTVSYDGVTTEEATICEWPCNLTVDNAITAALELTPLSLPLDGQ